MTEATQTCQPGIAFYETFVAGMRLKGSDLKSWSDANDVRPSNVRMAATGAWNGPRAVEVRHRMIAELGDDLFLDLYRKRLALDAERRGAA